MIERALRGLDQADLHIVSQGKRLGVRFAKPNDNGRERDLTLEDLRVLRVIQQSDEAEPYSVVVECVLRLPTRGDLTKWPGLGLQHCLVAIEEMEKSVDARTLVYFRVDGDIFIQAVAGHAVLSDYHTRERLESPGSLQAGDWSAGCPVCDPPRRWAVTVERGNSDRLTSAPRLLETSHTP